MSKFLPAFAIASVVATSAVVLSGGCSNAAPQDAETLERWEGTSFFDLQTRTLEGEPAELAQWRGDVVLVVNVASKCGLTPQYEGLQALYEEYRDRGLVVVGFPCNQFLGQEPGSPEEIAAFCETEFGVTFPMMEKVDVKDGEGQSPIYQYLGTRTGELPSWNFAKYLVSRDGGEVQYFGPRTTPDDAAFRAAVEAALGASQG